MKDFETTLSSEIRLSSLELDTYLDSLSPSSSPSSSASSSSSCCLEQEVNTIISQDVMTCINHQHCPSIRQQNDDEDNGRTRTILTVEQEEEQQRQLSAHSFYKSVLELLTRANMPFLLGGTQAYERYTGVRRGTKDLDIFARREDLEMIAHFLERNGYKTELTFPHWLAKVYRGNDFIDIIFSSANGTCPVTEHWFANATKGTVYGQTVQLIPVEEMIFSKAYIMEKERFDGGDVNHLIRCHGARLDWRRLLNHFDEHWRVLFGHLVLFGFVYPHDKIQCVPGWVMSELTNRLKEEHTDECQEENHGDSQTKCLGITQVNGGYSSNSYQDGENSVYSFHSHRTFDQLEEYEEQSDCNKNDYYRRNGSREPSSPPELLISGKHKNGSSKICNGPLISRAQYLTDVYKWGYTDGRLRSGMTPDDIYVWTRAMPDLVKYTEQLRIGRNGFNQSKNTNQ